MKERPLLISGPLIPPTRAGEKTLTRRLVKPQPVVHPGWGTISIVPDVAPVDGVEFEAGTERWAIYSVDYLSVYADEIARRFCPYGVPGDRLWVRERMRVVAVGDGRIRVVYAADGAESGWIDYPDRLARPVVGKCLAYGGHREASRIDLEVVSVRVERLQDITGADALAEGISPEVLTCIEDEHERIANTHHAARRLFGELWNQINGRRAPWSSNPWIWRVAFKLIRGGL